MKRIALLAALAAALCLTAATVHAQEPVKAPSLLLSLDRLSLGARFGYAWHSGAEENLPAFRKEFEIGAVGAYSLTPHVSLSFQALRGLDNKTQRLSLAVTIPVYVGGGK